MIKRIGAGKYILYSSDGTRKLSKPGTKADVLRRERQVQFFKHLGKASKGIKKRGSKR